MALIHLRNLKNKKAIWPALLIVLSQLKNVSDAISHWQNIQWVLQHVKELALKDHVQFAMLVAGLVWLAVIVLWPSKKDTEPISVTEPTKIDDRPLAHRILAMADELKDFLNSLGPEPEVVWRAGMNAREFEDANQAGIIRGRKMEAMFYRRYYQKVVDIYNEACELGTIQDAEIEQLFKTRVDNDATVTGIIARLAAVAADVAVKQPSRS